VLGLSRDQLMQTVLTGYKEKPGGTLSHELGHHTQRDRENATRQAVISKLKNSSKSPEEMTKASKVLEKFKDQREEEAQLFARYTKALSEGYTLDEIRPTLKNLPVLKQLKDIYPEDVQERGLRLLKDIHARKYEYPDADIAILDFLEVAKERKDFKGVKAAEFASHVLRKGKRLGKPTISKGIKRKGTYLLGAGTLAAAGLLSESDAEAGPRDLFRLTKNAAKFVASPTKGKVPGGAVHKPLGVMFTEGRSKLVNSIMESEEQDVKYNIKDLLAYAKEVKGEHAGVVRGAYKGKKPVLETTEKDLYDEYQKFLSSAGLTNASAEEKQRVWSEHLAEAYGAVKIKGTTTYRGSSKANQWLVLDPADVKVRRDPVAHPDELWIRPALKRARGIPEKDMSSSWARLNGTEFQGKKIKHVTQGHGNKRYIVTEDGAAIPVDKSVLNSLARARGTEKYVADFINKDSDGRLAQAFKSLDLHRARAHPNQKVVEDYFMNYRDQLKASNVPIPELSLVDLEGKFITLPKVYADILEPQGVIKKVKDLK